MWGYVRYVYVRCVWCLRYGYVRCVWYVYVCV
jgi:hypothetical protein